MLSGLQQKPVIALGVVPLVKFWKTGLEASRAHMTYAVERRMPSAQLCNIYRSQSALLEHVYKEATALDRRGWEAHALFRRRYPLSNDEQSVVEGFRKGALRRELRTLQNRLQVFNVDGDQERLSGYIREEYRLFPSLRNLFRGLVDRHMLDASKRAIRIQNLVDNLQQFKDPATHTRAKVLLESILGAIVAEAERATSVDITAAGLTITFSYQSRIRRSRLKQRIQNGADALGWSVAAAASPHGQDQLAVAISPTSLASSGTMARRKTTTQNLKALPLVSYADIVKLAVPFVKAQLYDGFLLTNGELDISRTPTFQVIESGIKLIEPIAYNMIRSMEDSCSPR